MHDEHDHEHDEAHSHEHSHGDETHTHAHTEADHEHTEHEHEHSHGDVTHSHPHVHEEGLEDDHTHDHDRTRTEVTSPFLSHLPTLSLHSSLFFFFFFFFLTSALLPYLLRDDPCPSDRRASSWAVPRVGRQLDETRKTCCPAIAKAHRVSCSSSLAGRRHSNLTPSS